MLRSEVLVTNPLVEDACWIAACVDRRAAVMAPKTVPKKAGKSPAQVEREREEAEALAAALPGGAGGGADVEPMGPKVAIPRLFAQAAWLLLTGVFALNAYSIRLYAIKVYGLVIHEFDPWFNFRATQYLADHGLGAFFK